MKKIVFLTGTRADFGKLKSLISISQSSDKYHVHIFATGMHMNPLYGLTIDEIYKSGFTNLHYFINHGAIEQMDRTLAKTVDGFSRYVADIEPDLIIVHGDRVEALAGAIVGSLNNILVAHIEGGELSGTIDEHIRHSVSKLSHIHLVSNDEAKRRLLQLGEKPSTIFSIGSPDLDFMNSNRLPSIESVKERYGIKFPEYALSLFHPVTTEYEDIRSYAQSYIDALLQSNFNYVVIYPNNDLGTIEILNEFRRIEHESKIKIYPSIRFESFLTLLRHARFIIGNSSAGIREAPYYDVPTVDIGTRQKNRAKLDSIFNCGYGTDEILNAVSKALKYQSKKSGSKSHFGEGASDKMFLELLESGKLWQVELQKQFQDIRL